MVQLAFCFFPISYAAENPPEERTPFWKLVLEQFDDMLVKILVGAAIISFVRTLMRIDHGKLSDQL